ncbi:MAG: ABC transporter substrate-binding protein [Dehalococcoidia bacterium]|nr:ABC transporter substrate-binding protein [Dehalococcoidia bacterium]
MSLRLNVRRKTGLARALPLAVLATFVLAAAALVAGCGGSEAPSGTERVTFMAGFRPQANLPFVAVYVAEAEGFFADEGLEVDIQHSSGQDEHLKLTVDGAVDFTTGTAAQVLRAAEEDVPLRAIALFGQRGDQGYVARVDSGIQGPEDFAGRSVGYKAGVVPAELVAMLDEVGLTPGDVELVSVGFDPRVFTERGVDVYPVFLNNEPDTIRKAGVEINVIDPHDYGVPTLGLAYLAHEDALATRADVVERFLRATMRATAWIASHPDQAVEITLRHAEGADADHQRYLLDTDLANAARADGIGRSSVEQWTALRDLLLAHEVISTEVDVTAVVDWAVLDGLYQDGAITSP